MSTKIVFGQEAVEKIMEGVSLLAKVVGTTLGPKGKNVAIDRPGEVWAIHDGVNIAKQVDPEDNEVNIGVRLLREAADRQVADCGDGTTAVTILGEAIVKEALKISATGINSMTLRKDLEEGSKKVIALLNASAKPIKTLEEKTQIATISAEDSELGKMIAETIDRIGTDGVVTVEDSKSSETFVEHQEGMQFDKGYISPYFITDPVRMEATVEDALVYLTDRNVTNINELIPFLEKVGKVGRNLVIIAPEVTDSALASFIATKVNGGMSLNCVQAPGVGKKQNDWLEDIAILTGGKVHTKESGVMFPNLEADILGKAARITSTKEATLIVGGVGNPIDIEDRVNALKGLLAEEESEFEQEKLKERIAKLTGGVAVIKVGGHTEVEMKERKERAIDAVASTKAAIEGGIVAGGEVAYLTARESLSKDNIAEKILYDALAKPFDKLMENAGLEPALYRDRIDKEKLNFGVDLSDNQVKDLIKEGIVDPVIVTTSAVANAVSVAIQIMNIDAIIIPVKEDKKGGSN